jgi:hypothetical protein
MSIAVVTLALSAPTSLGAQSKKTAVLATYIASAGLA